jgi:hypothetical protein
MRFVYGALMVAGSVMPALAQHAPEIDIPRRPDVPEIINGYDVSGAVVEGDWGLERPGHVAPTIVDGPLIPIPYYARGDYRYGRGYYPANGRRPGYGRREVEPPPNRALPPPAPSYHREYGVQSAPGPMTEYPPFETPPIVVAPEIGRRDYRQPRPLRHGMPNHRSSISPGRANPVHTMPPRRG